MQGMAYNKLASKRVRLGHVRAESQGQSWRRAHQQKVFDLRRNLAPNYSKVKLAARNSLAAAPRVLHNQIYANLRVLTLELLCTSSSEMLNISMEATHHAWTAWSKSEEIC